MHQYRLTQWLTIITQGLWVRAKTPRLPEALGLRDGEGGDRNLPELRLLVLGDSAAAGVGVEHQQQALIGQIVSELQQHYYVHWRLVAASGVTSEVAHKEFLPDLKTHQFDAAVLSLGVNDVTRFTSDLDWEKYQLSIWKKLLDEQRISKLLITPVPPMHKFSALPRKLATLFGERASALNALLKAFSEQFDDSVTLLDFDVPTDIDMLAKDGFHPSAKTYKLWAKVASQHLLPK